MTFSSGPVPNPTFPAMPAAATTTAYCVSGRWWQIIAIKAAIAIGAAAILAAIAGSIAAEFPAVGKAAKVVFDWLGNLLLSPPGGSLSTAIAGILAKAVALSPEVVAAAVLAAILAAGVTLAVLQAASCPNCPSGNSAFCLCVTFFKAIVIWIVPCTRPACTAVVPPGCP